jgi:hypothetical protein
MNSAASARCGRSYAITGKQAATSDSLSARRNSIALIA